MIRKTGHSFATRHIERNILISLYVLLNQKTGDFRIYIPMTLTFNIELWKPLRTLAIVLCNCIWFGIEYKKDVLQNLACRQIKNIFDFDILNFYSLNLFVKCLSGKFDKNWIINVNQIFILTHKEYWNFTFQWQWYLITNRNYDFYTKYHCEMQLKVNFRICLSVTLSFNIIWSKIVILSVTNNSLVAVYVSWQGFYIPRPGVVRIRTRGHLHFIGFGWEHVDILSVFWWLGCLH